MTKKVIFNAIDAVIIIPFLLLHLSFYFLIGDFIFNLLLHQSMGLSAWGWAVWSAYKIVLWDWKLVFMMMPFTMFLYLVGSHLHCCVLIQDFRSHLAHANWFEVIAFSIFWPAGLGLALFYISIMGYHVVDAILIAIGMFRIQVFRDGVEVNIDADTDF